MRIADLYRFGSQLHEQPRLASFASTPVGKFLIWLLATALLMPRGAALLVSPLLLMVLLLPAHRNAVLSLGSLWVLHERLWWYQDPGVAWKLAVFLSVLGFLYAMFRIARSFDRLPPILKKHPQISLHVGLWIVLACTWFLPRLVDWGHSGWWPAAVAFTGILPFVIWRLGYLLLSGSRGTIGATGFVDHLFYCLPAFAGPRGGTPTPYGKGHDDLTRQRAEEPEKLAASQLAGMKLLVLSLLWNLVQIAILAGVHGQVDIPGSDLFRGWSLGIPRADDLIAAQPLAEGSIPVAWISLFLMLIVKTLTIAAWGHVIIGCLRLFGYNVFRNTYKPLLAESLIDFWNRYYYYFKELLVELFFYPTYIAWFRNRPRLRIFAATVAAACIGNSYYHFLRDWGSIVEGGMHGVQTIVLPRLIYTSLLAMGIFFSLLRQQQRRGHAVPEESAWTARLLRIRRIAGVWVFFSLIHVWALPVPEVTLAQRASFVLSLIGL